MKKLILILICFLPIQAFAVNTGYTPIIEVKAWGSFVQVVMGVDHECTDTLKSHYRLDYSKREEYALLLTAFSLGMTVSAGYVCDANGYPQINVIRAKN